MMAKIHTDGLPDGAKKIREAVFVEEQGFLQEFDRIDDRAAHIVLYDEEQTPIATCRVFADRESDSYIIGRLAVIKEYRGQKIGAAVIREAEQYIIGQNGQSAALHAQCRVTAFYEKLGFHPYGKIEDDEGCPHVWMRKQLSRKVL